MARHELNPNRHVTGRCGGLRILRDLVLIENPFLYVLKSHQKIRIRRNREIAQKIMVSHS